MAVYAQSLSFKEHSPRLDKTGLGSADIQGMHRELPRLKEVIEKTSPLTCQTWLDIEHHAWPKKKIQNWHIAK